jgi:hypothetical protein
MNKIVYNLNLITISKRLTYRKLLIGFASGTASVDCKGLIGATVLTEDRFSSDNNWRGLQ